MTFEGHDFRAALEDYTDSAPHQISKGTRRAIEAALRAAASDGWRDIESAPKDGTPILAFAPMATEPAIARWFKWDAADQGWITELIDGGPWKDDHHFAEYWAETSYEPTHWMPLPAPPKGSDDESE